MPGCKGSSGTGMRYKLTLATGLLECLCFAGVVFGWASLVFVLKTDGYFSELCINVTNASGELGSGEAFNVLDGSLNFMLLVRCLSVFRFRLQSAR